VRKIRVGLNNNAPLVTRVVMEIADGATYDVRRNSPTDRELTVVFKGPAAAAGTAGAKSEARGREDAALAMLGAETITLAQAIANGAPLAPRDAVIPGGAMTALKARPQDAAPAAERSRPRRPRPHRRQRRHRRRRRFSRDPRASRSPAAIRRSTSATRSAWTSRASISAPSCAPSRKSAA
jgi:hypothetical protein